jgi:crotonobetainyl-CoA:carnitine CoA-transferase CaiB-like acyl-CoA transferase
MVGRFEDVPGVGREIRLVRTGVKVDGEPPRVDTPPPRLGEHTEVLLEGLGYSPGEIAQLKRDGVI